MDALVKTGYKLSCGSLTKEKRRNSIFGKGFPFFLELAEGFGEGPGEVGCDRGLFRDDESLRHEVAPNTRLEGYLERDFS